jgi:hypothetical protein
MTFIISRVLVPLLLCAACSDVTAIVGRLHPARDAGPFIRAADAGNPRDGGAPVLQPSDASPETGLVADSGTQVATVDAGPPVLTRTPALAPPARAKPWAIEPGTRDQYCAGHGSALRSADCTPIERQLFAYAICTCADARLDGDSFTLDGFDSSQGAYAPGEGGAAMGVDGALLASAPDIQLGGSVIVTGSDPLSITSKNLLVRGDLESSASLTLSGAGLRVARDAWLAGDIGGGAPGSVVIGRDAYVKPGVKGSDALRGDVLLSSFSLAPPCACDPSALLDVPGIVAMAHDFADNDAVGFSKDTLRQRVDTTAVPLPCGRLILSELSIPVGTIAVTVSGRTALFIEGDIDITGTFAFVLADGAELDLFVAGDLKLQGTGAFGISTKPSATRIYVGGQVAAYPMFNLAAAMYAPHAALSGLPEDVYGAAFVGSFATSGTQKFHYDRAILNTPAKCSSAGRACARCDDCADGLACVGGSCGACAADSDCCAPLVCSSGRCGALDLPQP